MTDKGYPTDWDDDETFEEIECTLCKPTARHKLDYTFTSRAGYKTHMNKVHNKEGKAPKKKVLKSATTVTCDQAMQNIQDSLDAAEERNSPDALVDQLTRSVENASMRNKDSETRISTKDNTKMAAKKKVSKKVSKKTAAKASNGEKKVQTAEAIGRERKLLLRLSNDEYNALQAKAAKQGVSMAMLLRSSFQ